MIANNRSNVYPHCQINKKFMKTILNNDVFNGRKCLLINIYLCFYLSSCTHESMDDLSVMTYNIRYASFNEDQENWNNRKEGVVNLLHQHDFVGLQEATPVQINDIIGSCWRRVRIDKSNT
jgi:hypothetical protein